MSKKSQANKKLKGTQKASNARERMRQQQAAETRRKNRLRIVIAAVVVVAVMVGAGIAVNYYLSKRDVTVTETVGADDEVVQSIEANTPMTWGKGEKTLRVYFDFNCSHCIEFEHAYGSVVDEALTSGKVKVELYPMAFLAPSSVNVANAYVCASEEGFGYQYQKAVWQNAGREWNNEQLLQVAEQVAGSSPNSTFTSCVQRITHRDTIVANTQHAFETEQVPGTPYVLVDGEPVDLKETSPDDLKSQLGL